MSLRDVIVKVKAFPWRQKSPAQSQRIDAIVGWFAGHLPMTSDWRIQKAFYLAEVRSIEERQERLSQADFAAWDHGPWSYHIREAYERLCAVGALIMKSVKATKRAEVDVYEVQHQRKIPDLDQNTEDFLEDFITDLKFVSGDEVTARAKATEPYRRTKQRGLIDLDGYLEEIRRRHAALQRSKKARQLVEEAVAGG